GHVTLLGRTTRCTGEIDWAGRDATPTWRVALHGLEHLAPAGFAAVLAESSDERAAWWRLVAGQLQEWLTRGRRGHGAAARLEAALRAESPDERSAWWRLVAGQLQEWLTRGRRGHGAAARLEAQTRRVTNLIQLATIFAGELEADPELRRALLESVYMDATSLAV